MDTDEWQSYLTDKVKFCTLMAKISLAAAIIFAGYGFVIGNNFTIMIGMFFAICFFGFMYGKRIVAGQKTTSIKSYYDVNEQK